MDREAVFKNLEARLTSLQLKKSTPLRVAINGIEGTGKTVFARSFVDFLKEREHEAIHVTIDGYHFHKEHRYRQGRDSAKGYYEDSYHETAFVEKVLQMSQESLPCYVPAIHDLETDEYLDIDPVQIARNAILVVDGAYLFKPVYRPYWDLTVYLDVDFSIALKRGIKRDADNLGGAEHARQKYVDRYHAASKMYIEEVNPKETAEVVIDNTVFEDIRIVKG